MGKHDDRQLRLSGAQAGAGYDGFDLQAVAGLVADRLDRVHEPVLDLVVLIPDQLHLPRGDVIEVERVQLVGPGERNDQLGVVFVGGDNGGIAGTKAFLQKAMHGLEFGVDELLARPVGGVGETDDAIFPFVGNCR